MDYRALNFKTIKDAHPLPRIDESMDALKGARLFSSLDLQSAYNQVQMHPDDQHKTAFSSPLGLYYFQSKLASLNPSINNTYSLYIAMKRYSTHKSTIQRTPIHPNAVRPLQCPGDLSTLDANSVS